jgi:hypothetical protein
MLILNLLQEHLDKEIVLSGPRYTPGQDAEAPNMPISTLLMGLIRNTDCNFIYLLPSGTT